MRLHRLRRNNQVTLSLLALVIGAGAAYGAIGFRRAIDLVQSGALGFASDRVATLAAGTPWWRLLLAPTLGGLLIGLFIHYAMPGRRPRGVAEVIEAGALRAGRMSIRAGLGAAAVNAASIGVGASVGREGPAVHLGASLASWLAARLALPRAQAMTLLGCGIASAIAASFNAPIAGVFFALEVVLGHYALNAFAPIVIAAVTGTVITRIHFGAFPAFVVSQHTIASFWEFPAFALLGLVSGFVAILFLRGVPLAENLGARIPVPAWARPAIAGLVVGVIALAFPQVLGVGYEATDMALKQLYPLWLLIALLVAKMIATVVCLGGGFGGGVFSPSLVIGAMLGGAYGIIATSAFPELSSGHGAYALIGMGAVAGAVLGAPISTIFIIFELTGDFQFTIAVMAAVVIASVLTQQVLGRSFFTMQLERRGLNLRGGREIRLLRALPVRDVMGSDYDTIRRKSPIAEVRERLQASPHGELFMIDGACVLHGTITFADLHELAFDTSDDDRLRARDVARRHPPILLAGDNLETAIKLFGEVAEPHVAVVDGHDTMRLVGVVHEREVMLAYNRALLQARAEERGEA